MTSRRAAFLLALLGAIIGMLIWFLQHEPPPSASANVSDPLAPESATAKARARRQSTPNPARSEILTPGPDGIILPPEAKALAGTLNAADGTAEQDLETLGTLVGLFRRANLGANPAGGLHEEIVEQLLGKNPRHLAVLPRDCPGLDNQGQLLDRWGTPYFLHPLSKEILEIRSAGPDRKLRTPDDVKLSEDEHGIPLGRGPQP